MDLFSGNKMQKLERGIHIEQQSLRNHLLSILKDAETVDEVIYI